RTRLSSSEQVGRQVHPSHPAHPPLQACPVLYHNIPPFRSRHFARPSVRPRRTPYWHTARLDEEQFDLAFCVGFVLDTFRDKDHCSSREVDCAVTKIDPQRSLYNDECLVRVFMIVLNEIPLQFYNLELIVVHLGNDFRLPLFFE